MAIEISLRISGDAHLHWRQAIFLDESDLDQDGVFGDITLEKVRSIISEQGIEGLPENYRFLTLRDNAIPLVREETTRLREVLPDLDLNLDAVVNSEVSEKDNTKQIKKQEKAVELEGRYFLWIMPIDENHHPTSQAQGQGADDFHQDTQVNGPNHNQDAMNAQACPWKKFVNLVHDHNSSQNLFKFLFFLLVILFMMLVSLVLATQVIFGTLSSLTASPGFSSILSTIKSDGGSTQDLTNLKVKLSSLEVSWQYKFDQLNSKLAELEDLYLSDLAIHKKEMASLKSHQTDASGDFASQTDLDLVAARLDQLTEEIKQGLNPERRKNHNGKKGKKNKAKEGA